MQTILNDSATPDAGHTSPMHAIVQERYGPPDILRYESLPRPSIKASEVLLEVRAAGVDRGTEHLMTGLPYVLRVAGYGVLTPNNRVLGADVAGRVVEVGANVSRLALGDEVFGIANGSFAEYAAACEEKLAIKPSSISFEQAAVATISGITALEALTDVGHVEAGHKVLVIGASGGVGTFAVQLAKAFGAEVTGVASTGKQEMVRSIGADHVIDYRRTDFADGKISYDLILDCGGRRSISRLRRVLSSTGTLVIVGGENGNRLTGGVGRQLRAMALSPFVGQRLTSFINSESLSLIERLAEHLSSGKVTPVIGQRFSLDKVPEAMRQMAAGRFVGKTAIIVSREE